MSDPDDELLDFTSALTNETYHNDVSVRVARHHSEQHALADAGPGEQPHTLTTSDTKKRVYGTDTHIEWVLDWTTFEWIDWLAK